MLGLMRTKVLLFVIFCSVKNGNTQNLVGNPSMEDYSQCPYQEDQVPFATGWQNWCLTPDYLNVCSSSQVVGVPYNLSSNYQYAATGQGFCGFFAYYSSMFIVNHTKNVRENIARQLDTPLVIGTKYFVSIKVNPVITNGQNCTCDKIGVLFTTKSFAQYANDSITTPLTKNFAHVYSDQIITDSANWSTIKGSFIADSTYEYIVIGNFFDDAHTDSMFMVPNTNWCWSYYFVDDVCVSADSLTCGVPTFISEVISKESFKILPNPAFNSITLQFHDQHFWRGINGIDVYNEEGFNVLHFNKLSVSQSIDVSGILPGIYWLRISGNDFSISCSFSKN